MRPLQTQLLDDVNWDTQPWCQDMSALWIYEPKGCPKPVRAFPASEDTRFVQGGKEAFFVEKGGVLVNRGAADGRSYFEAVPKYAFLDNWKTVDETGLLSFDAAASQGLALLNEEDARLQGGGKPNLTKRRVGKLEIPVKSQEAVTLMADEVDWKNRGLWMQEMRGLANLERGVPAPIKAIGVTQPTRLVMDDGVLMVPAGDALMQSEKGSVSVLSKDMFANYGVLDVSPRVSLQVARSEGIEAITSHMLGRSKPASVLGQSDTGVGLPASVVDVETLGWEQAGWRQELRKVPASLAPTEGSFYARYDRHPGGFFPKPSPLQVVVLDKDTRLRTKSGKEVPMKEGDGLGRSVDGAYRMLPKSGLSAYKELGLAGPRLAQEAQRRARIMIDEAVKKDQTRGGVQQDSELVVGEKEAVVPRRAVRLDGQFRSEDRSMRMMSETLRDTKLAQRPLERPFIAQEVSSLAVLRDEKDINRRAVAFEKARDAAARVVFSKDEGMGSEPIVSSDPAKPVVVPRRVVPKDQGR